MAGRFMIPRCLWGVERAEGLKTQKKSKTYGQNQNFAHYSTLKKIQATKIAELALEWCEERFDELLRIEAPQVVHGFADAHVANRDPQLIRDSKNHSTLGRAVQLGEHNTGNRHRFSKDLRLRDRVLSAGRVDDQPGLVRCARGRLAERAADLLQLLHETGLGVEPSGGVGDRAVEAL